MNFAAWILNRIKNTLVNSTRWEWVEKYRRQIIIDKPFSIFITIVGGLIWFMIASVLSLMLIDTRETFFLTLRCALLAVPTFYVYHWLSALYEIYDTERMATWERLKDTHL